MKREPGAKRTEVRVAGEHVGTIIEHGARNVSWMTSKHSGWENNYQDAYNQVMFHREQESAAYEQD